MDFRDVVDAIGGLQTTFIYEFDSLKTIIQDMNTPTGNVKAALESVRAENSELKSEMEKIKINFTAELASLKMAVATLSEVDKVQPFVDQSFRRFAESLKCDEEFCVEWSRLVNNVASKIVTHAKFLPIQCWVGGSVMKNSDVIAPDFDIVFEINCQHPPFKTVLEDFHNILLFRQDQLNIQSGSLQRNEFRLGFAFRNGIKVDLVPACHLPLEEIKRKMLDNKEESKGYSGSLVKSAVGFMKAQDSFTNSIVRLGKFWFNSCHFGEKVNGGSTMIELISVAAAMKELQMPVKSELRALTRIIEMAQNIDMIKIAFKKNSSGKWELIPVEILNKGNVAFEGWGVCSESTLKRNYYLLEPINPLNDLLQDKSPELISKLKKYAGVTKQRLDALKKNIAGQKFVEFEKIFEPQPSNLREVFRAGFPSHITVFNNSFYSSIYPEEEFANAALLERAEVIDVVNAVKRNIIWTVHASQRWSPDLVTSTTLPRASPSQIKFLDNNFYSSLRTLIETNLQVKSDRDFGTDNWDVVITVPFRTKWGSHAACLEMMWSGIE